MSRRKGSKLVKRISFAVVGLALIGGLYWGRKDANGFRNLFSYKYWSDRFTGVETYKPDLQLFTRGSRSHMDVCFTFDDGPHVTAAPMILDALKAAGIHATFFVVGIRVKQHPELVKRMIDEGNEVGNHTQDHLRLDTLPLKKVRAEIEQCATNIERACGRRPTLLRPPGVRYTHNVLELASALGYTTVGWNVGASDFIPLERPNMSPAEVEALHTTPDQIVERVMKQLKPGVIILLHDNPVTAKAVPKLFREVKEEGYAIKTVTQMMAELSPPVDVVADPPATDLAAKKTP